MSTCAELECRFFIGAPADGSVFLNSVKLWTLARLGKIKYGFEYDLHEDVFESCAYHHWGLFESQQQSMAILILGAAFEELLAAAGAGFVADFLPREHSRIRLRCADRLIARDGRQSVLVRAGEAVSWGKVNPETYTTQTVSMQGDYSSYMPFLVRALVGKDLLHNRRNRSASTASANNSRRSCLRRSEATRKLCRR